MPDVANVVRALASAAGAEATVFTASTKTYIKTINVMNPTATSQAFDLKIGAQYIAKNLNIPMYGGARDSDTHVMVNGETLRFAASDDEISITVSYIEET